MIKFKNSEADEISRVQPARADRRSQASFPRRSLLPRLAVLSIFLLVGVLFAYFQPVILKNLTSLSKRMVSLRLPGNQ